MRLTRMRRLLVPALMTMMIAVPASPASAEFVLDRVQVGVPKTPTRAFPESLSVVLIAPDLYSRGCCYDFVSGEWVGPRWRLGAAERGPSRIRWSVELSRTSRSTAALARDAGWAGYAEAAAAARKVPHIVEGRTVGTLEAFAAIDTDGAPSARHQGALAIDLGQRVKAVALFHLPDPPFDDFQGAPLSVDGRRASEWNRRQAELAIEKVYVEGSLPPRKVKAKGARGRVSGRVTDSFGHPVAESALTLQKRAGSKWRKAGKGIASSRGTYSLSARGKGQYRVVAKLGATSARSKGVRIK